MTRDPSEATGSGDDVPVVLAGVTVGNIVREGKAIRVDALRADGSYRVLGYYERSEDSTFQRKVGEIHAIFDAWSAADVRSGRDVKINWRGRDAVPAFRELPGAKKSGCSVVEKGGIPIAYVYKLRENSALWVDA